MNSRERMELGPEEMAKAGVVDYWTRRLEQNKEDSSNVETQVQGGDFDVARCEAYIEQARAGKLFEDVAIAATYDGEPSQAIEPSAYQYFKRIADEDEVRKYSELFANKPDLVAKRKQEAEQAQMLIEQMERLKFAA